MDTKQVSVKPDSICEVPQDAEDNNIEIREFEVKECTEENTDGCESYGKNGATSTPDGKIVNLEYQNSGEYQKTSSSHGIKTKYTVPKPFTLVTEKRVRAPRTSGVNADGSDGNYSPKYSGVNSPKSLNSSQNSPLSRRLYHGDQKKPHHDDDDCWSLTSSAAGSGRTDKFKTTVGSAPKFRCTERAEKRKEFHKKVEEKHQALEEEKKQSEARIKEEQDAILKQQRKNATYKANPVPDFYRQGPPPKRELKKLPVTQPKSPKFNTSRKKSSNQVVAPSVEETKKSSSMEDSRQWKN